MGLRPKNPVASFVERENDDPLIEEAGVDLDIEMPGTRVATNEPVDGIDLIDEEDGGVIVDFDPQAMSMTDGGDFFANLAEDMDSGDLGAISSDLISQYVSAKESRGDWEEEYDKGLDLLGFKYEDRTQPFPSHDLKRKGNAVHKVHQNNFFSSVI